MAAELQEEVACSLCGKPTREYCSTMACRACHKTESLEDCLAGAQAEEIRRAMREGRTR